MSTVDFKFENGDKLRDKPSGFEGIVMVRAEYSTGCVHYGLLSQTLKDGAPMDWHWIDQSRLELVAEKAVSFDVDPTKTSGAFPSGPQS
jgi:hypothetical protein